ncbi:MAG: hypothetical protein ABSB35_10650 [Bryobacteraceae bacterium]|jgi:hypothetical protein
MMLKDVFAMEVYVRLSGDDEFTCTTRLAGFPVFVRRFRITEVPLIPSGMEESGPVTSVRRPDRHIEARWKDEG